MSSIYRKNGYKNRAEYLRGLSEDYGVPLDTVRMLAQILGPDEDFDGLVSAVADASEENF